MSIPWIGRPVPTVIIDNHIRIDGAAIVWVANGTKTRHSRRRNQPIMKLAASFIIYKGDPPTIAPPLGIAIGGSQLQLECRQNRIRQTALGGTIFVNLVARGDQPEGYILPGSEGVYAGRSRLASI